MQSSPIKPISMRMSQGTSVKSVQKDRMFEDDINDRLDFDKSLNIQSSAQKPSLVARNQQNTSIAQNASLAAQAKRQNTPP